MDSLIEEVHIPRQTQQPVYHDDGLIQVSQTEPEPENKAYNPFEKQESMSDEEIYHRRIGVVEAGIEDNCRQHGVRGILEHSHIQAMIAEYTEEDKQARVYGKFQHLTGLVFKEFSRKIHIVKPFFPKPKDFCVVELLDPHPRNPDAVMWVAFNDKGQAFVVDEMFEKFSSVEEMAYKIKQKGSQYRIIQRRADPSLWTPATSDRSNVTLGDKLHELGLTYIQASKQRTMGIQLIHDALNYQANVVDGYTQFIKAPMLYVFDTCVRTIWEFEHWQYNEWKGKSTETRNQSEKPMDKDDHMMEDLGRFFLDQPHFEQMPTVAERSGIFAQSSEPNLDPFKG